MIRLLRSLRIPATESQMGFVLALCAVVMAVMSAGLIWQAQIISQQRDTIHFLESLRFGG